MASAAIRIDLPQEAQKALAYFETRGTTQDRRYLADELSHAILAARWRVAQRRAVESAMAAGGIPSEELTEEDITALAVAVTTSKSREG